jgi:MFS transporter, Spinster family, sphingosine-1-phosphate transporter
MTTQPSPVIAAVEDQLRSAQQWRVVACLTVLSMLAMLDKNVMTLLVAGIKADLGLTDTQVGLIIGLAFAVANFAVSVPAGWLADRMSRRAIVASGVALWSCMATACGAANSFWQMFMARAGVGFGEGIIPPASYSLIRDAVHPSVRGRAFSVYGMATSVGTGLSLILGGVLVGAIAASGLRELPIVGSVHPWQTVLIIIGIAGMPLAVLAYFFRDPGRTSGPPAATFREAWFVARPHRRALFALLAFSSLHALMAGSLSAWLPALLGRKFGATPQVVGPILGTLLMVCAPIGLGAAGVLMDRVRRHGIAGAGIAACGAAIVFLIAAILVPSAASLQSLWIFQAFVLVSSTVYLPVTSTVVSHLLPSQAIGKTMAIYLLTQGVVGSGLAPVIVAVVSDNVFASDPHGLGHALVAVLGIYGILALTAAVALYGSLRSPAPSAS